MSEEVVRVTPKGVKKKKSEVPLTVVWNNERMIRVHSIRAAVREMLAYNAALDLVRVNIIGTPSTGKSTLAAVIAHLAHKLADIPYTVKRFTRDDLLNFEEVLSKLQPTNHILIFDDISFLNATAGKRHLDKIQKTFTEIRHLPGGQDVKILAIMNFHYNMSVPKYLRQSDYFLYTSVGSSELENTLNIIGKKYTRKLIDFRKLVQQGVTTGKVTFMMGRKGQKFEYAWRKPFAPILFWNQSSARTVVFPKREWIDNICPTCSHASTTDEVIEMNINKFDEDLKGKFGVGILRQALKIKLFNMGVSTYNKNVKRCMRYIDMYFEKEVCNPEQVADFYKLRDQRTRLDVFP